eukprot:Skav235264  [mRNA]  locus=scaffold874:131420:136271:+ [translate_table: standard]
MLQRSLKARALKVHDHAKRHSNLTMLNMGLSKQVSTNLILGFFLIAVGICVLAFGALRYFDVMEGLENGVFMIDTGGVLLVCGATGALVILAPRMQKLWETLLRFVRCLPASMFRNKSCCKYG